MKRSSLVPIAIVLVGLLACIVALGWTIVSNSFSKEWESEDSGAELVRDEETSAADDSQTGDSSQAKQSPSSSKPEVADSVASVGDSPTTDEYPIVDSSAGGLEPFEATSAPNSSGFSGVIPDNVIPTD